MISTEEWWSIIERYGEHIRPFGIAFYIIAVLLTAWLVIKPNRLHTILIKAYLALALAWNGILFFLVLARDITGNSYGSYLFGSLFIAAAVLFAIDIFRRKMTFVFPKSGWRKYMTLALLLLALSYPFFSLALGRGFSGLLIPGVFPCPTTALALLVLTTALPRANPAAYIILLFWAIPFPLFLQIPQHGVYEDAVMFASGAYSLVLLILSRKAKNKAPGSVET